VTAGRPLNIARSIFRRLPYIRPLYQELSNLRAEVQRWRTWKPPGHFYSPIPALDEVRADAGRIFDNPSPLLSGVALNADRQLEVLRRLAKYHDALPRQWQAPGLSRYHYSNPYYAWADGIVLYSMLRSLAPRRVVEVGSGFSSAVVLDTDEMFLNSSIKCTFIDPYPERLLKLLRASDMERCSILKKRVQDVEVDVFQELTAGDILLIDSSHVSKTGSDVNQLLFDVLPALEPGVYVHFHDIFYPFEYPRSWVEQGVSWNEAYLLHAFLQYNTAYSIQFFTSYLVQRHPDLLAEHLPLAMNSECRQPQLTDAPGASLWLLRERTSQS
jgi:hypothetical protein